MVKYLGHIFCCFYQKSKTKSKRYKRQSFDKRICDDLSEEILQYLPLQNKVILECVSKQFQRTIFVKQIELSIKGLITKSEFQFKGHIYKEIFLDSVLFELLLKKCPNIRSINLNSLHFLMSSGFCFEKKTIISLLNKYCHHLNRFDFHSTFDFMIEEKTGSEFINKFGSQLVSIDGIDFKNEKFLKIFPNIKELSIDCTLCQLTVLKENHFKKLKRISIRMSAYDMDDFNLFLDRHKNLKYLDLDIFPWIDKTSDNDLTTNCKKTLHQLSKLKHLVHLEIYMPFGVCERLSNSWENVFLDCNQIKRLEVCYMITKNDSSKFRHFAKSLKECIKRLKIRFINDMPNNADPNYLLTLRDWKGFSNISHLILEFRDFQPLNEKFLTEIYKTLPNVQYLEINEVFVTEEGSTQMADTLSRLSRLETLKLFVSNELICNQIKAKVIEKCKMIRIIDIEVKKLNQ